MYGVGGVTWSDLLSERDAAALWGSGGERRGGGQQERSLQPFRASCAGFDRGFGGEQ